MKHTLRLENATLSSGTKVDLLCILLKDIVSITLYEKDQFFVVIEYKNDPIGVIFDDVEEACNLYDKLVDEWEQYLLGAAK